MVVLTIAKRVEEKHKKTFFVFKAISLGDERLREIHHQSLHFYSKGKEKAAFWLKKQLPLKLRSLWNRALVLGKESTKKLVGDLRDSRLLKKKSDGMSEFFKNISDIEKGNGEINEVYLEETRYKEQETVIPEQIPAKPNPTTPSLRGARRKYTRRKKIAVVEIE